MIKQNKYARVATTKKVNDVSLKRAMNNLKQTIQPPLFFSPALK